MKLWYDWLAIVLLLVGGLNWGLIGAFNGFNLVKALFGSWPWVMSLVYILVGLSALYMAYYFYKEE